MDSAYLMTYRYHLNECIALLIVINLILILLLFSYFLNVSSDVSRIYWQIGSSDQDAAWVMRGRILYIISFHEHLIDNKWYNYPMQQSIPTLSQVLVEPLKWICSAMMYIKQVATTADTNILSWKILRYDDINQWTMQKSHTALNHNVREQHNNNANSN